MSKQGFTAIEMLVALALTAAIMSALLGVVSNLTPGSEAVSNSTGIARPLQQAVSVMETDLRHATQAEWIDGRLVLDCYASVDPVSLETAASPSRVSYWIVEAGGRSWLMRRQYNPLDPTGESFTIPILADVGSLQQTATEASPADIELRNAQGQPLATVRLPETGDPWP